MNMKGVRSSVYMDCVDSMVSRYPEETEKIVGVLCHE